jgi:uncharacterized protein YegP (UPF0339 family)
MTTASIEIYKDDTGEHRWRLVARNGRILANGEGYKRPSGAEKAARTIREAMATAIIIRIKP